MGVGIADDEDGQIWFEVSQRGNKGAGSYVWIAFPSDEHAVAVSSTALSDSHVERGLRFEDKAIIDLRVDREKMAMCS